MDHRLIEKVYGRAFLQYVNTSLVANEQLIDAIPAVSEDIAMFNRPDREGTLGLTNFRLFFVAKQSGRDWPRFSLFEIKSVDLDKGGLGSKYLTIRYSGNQTRFLIGKKQADHFVPALERLLRLTRDAEKRIDEERRNGGSSN